MMRKLGVSYERRAGGATFDDVRALVAGARGRRVYETGDVDAGIWTAGIVMGLITDCPSCEVLLRRIEREAEDAIGAMQAMRVPAAPQAKL